MEKSRKSKLFLAMVVISSKLISVRHGWRATATREPKK